MKNESLNIVQLVIEIVINILYLIQIIAGVIVIIAFLYVLAAATAPHQLKLNYIQNSSEIETFIPLIIIGGLVIILLCQILLNRLNCR
jgi:hypothetical protein